MTLPLTQNSLPPWAKPIKPKPPSSWGKDHFSWHDDAGEDPRFLRSFKPINTNALGTDLDIVLFDIAFSFADAYEKPNSAKDDSQLTNYVVCYRSKDDAAQQTCLRQHKGCLFVADDETELNEVSLDMLSKKQRRGLPCVDLQPRWPLNDAIWPHQDEVPFCFIGQSFDAKNDSSFYLFASRANGVLRFAGHEVWTSNQTADEHYVLEDFMCGYGRICTNAKDMASHLSGMGKSGQIYILDHCDLPRQALRHLAKNGMNTSIRNRAQNKLTEDTA